VPTPRHSTATPARLPAAASPYELVHIVNPR
jgi:hypothetical protein